MKRYFSLLILVGVLVILFPSLQEKYYDWQQDKVMDKLQLLQSDLSKLNHSFKQAMNDSSSTDPAIEEKSITNVDTGALGVIVIDKIDVQLPILEDATETNMKLAATHLVETAPIGSEGNAAIAAHRAHKKGRLFNRLGELKIGDQIDVTLADQTHIRYKIDQISVVEPTDLSVLEDPHLGQVLTLITCDPLINPTHRLIVRAVADTANAPDHDLS